jgi:ribonucleoside-diphosphate reductase alpha chain
MTALTPRPETLIGSTYKIKWPESEHALYVTINDIEEDGKRRPFEIFINSKNMEHYAWTLALTRMISAVFRRGGDVSFVAEELKAVFDPRGGAWLGGRYVPSLLAAIGDVIQRHLDNDAIKAVVAHDTAAHAKPRSCPKCGAAALIRAEGCDKCLECGYSKCS